jgi:predicted metalloprotease
MHSASAKDEIQFGGDWSVVRDARQSANVRQVVRKLTHSKLAKVEGHAEDLATLLDELRLMMNLGANAKQGCPIIDDMDQRISDDC